jgi:hypothetical protein
MFWKSKIAPVALVALTLTGTAMATSNEAQARPYWGIAAGIAAGAFLGATVAANSYGYYGYGYRRCRFIDRYDYYGNYVGTRKVCRVVW